MVWNALMTQVLVLSQQENFFIEFSNDVSIFCYKNIYVKLTPQDLRLNGSSR